MRRAARKEKSTLRFTLRARSRHWNRITRLALPPRVRHDQGMTLNSFRRFLYTLAKYLGDAQAITSRRKGSVSRRVGRRIAGRITGKGLGKLFK